MRNKRKSKKLVQKLALSKETPTERKKRVSQGVKFRTAIFEDKRHKKIERRRKFSEEEY